MIKPPRSWSFVEYPQLDSTNIEAERLIEKGGINHGTVLYALQQSAGKGTQGKSWASPLGNLYMTAVLKAVDYDNLHQLSFLTALAVSEALEAALGDAGLNLQFKWPNDIFANKAKMGGILIETKHGSDGLYIINGIGVNLISHPELAADAGYAATDVQAETGVTLSVEDMLSFITFRLSSWLERWTIEGFHTIRLKWLQKALGLGQQVTIRTSSMEESGIFVDLSEQGAIVLSQGSDITQRKSYYAGVAHIKLQ